MVLDPITIYWLELIAGSAIIVAFFALVGEGVSRLIRRVGKRAGFRETALVAIRDTARAVWIIVAIVVVAFYTHLASELTLLAVSTVGGLVLSLALQATLSNVIAGVFLLQDGTLRLGDDITYSGVAGKVIRITLRTTWITTDKGFIAAIANSQLMSGPLINRTATARLVEKYHLQSEMSHEEARPTDGASSQQTLAGPAPEAGKAESAE